MVVQTNEITVAHSPDPDDAFMFYAVAANKLDTNGLKIKQVMKDIQTLNQEAVNKKYEVSAISFAAYPAIAEHYALMSCGASMGYKYGPILVAKRPLSDQELKGSLIAIPGELTTAYLVLQLFQADLKVTVCPFNEILDAVERGDVDAGLLIHEGQLTYAASGLQKIVDLGEWWYDLTSLPLPLGGNAVRRDLGAQRMREVTLILKESILYSLQHREEALEYALSFARDMQKDLADKYVGMYVNDLTVDCGEDGRRAVQLLFKMAYEKGIYKKLIEPEFVG
jgi:1,4-dihydroxy-6-naphthoate synthase